MCSTLMIFWCTQEGKNKTAILQQRRSKAAYVQQRQYPELGLHQMVRACSRGRSSSSSSFLTSRANTASGGAVESMQDDLMEITKLPVFFRKNCAFRPTIRAWQQRQNARQP